MRKKQALNTIRKNGEYVGNKAEIRKNWQRTR